MGLRNEDNADSTPAGSEDVMTSNQCVHEFRPIDSSGQLACIHCNARYRPELAPARCGWFGEGRGQCLFGEGHKGHHTCQEDGRLLLPARIKIANLESQLAIAMTGLGAVVEAERRTVETSEGSRYKHALEKIVARYDGFTSAKEMMQWAHEALDSPPEKASDTPALIAPLPQRCECGRLFPHVRTADCGNSYES